MKRIALLSLVLVLAACGSSADTTTTVAEETTTTAAAEETTTTAAETTTTAAEATTTTVAETTTTAAALPSCPDATTAMSNRLIEVADELVVTPADDIDQQFLADLNQEMFNLGYVLGETCGADTGSAMSTAIVDVMAHGEAVGGETQLVVGSLIGGMCGNLGEIVLDEAGNEACATAAEWLS